MATTPPAASPDDAASTDKDWPAQATEAIVSQVDKIRDKTTGPVLKGARYAVFAVFAVALGVVALILLLIGSVRALNNYLPGDVWAAHTLLGAILVLVGSGLYLTKARQKPEAA